MFDLLGSFASLIGSYRLLGTPYEGGTDSCPEASATNYQLTLCNVLDRDDLNIYFERNSNFKLNEGTKVLISRNLTTYLNTTVEEFQFPHWLYVDILMYRRAICTFLEGFRSFCLIEYLAQVLVNGFVEV